MILRSFLLITAITYSSAKVDVAIIGGGIGGASSAYFLNEMKPDKFNIDLYEAEKIGGRVATVEYNGHHYEHGGSIIHSKNRYMKQFVEKFGLEVRKGCTDDFGIFNGSRLIFKSSHYDLLTAFKLWWRYGGDIFRLDNHNTRLINAFQRIYEGEKLLNYPFNTTIDLMRYIDHSLVAALSCSTYEGLKAQAFSEKFINELVACIVRCNYCQSLNIHLFVGSVAVAGAGADLWSVEGGNWQVADRLIKASGASFIHDKVVYVSAIDDTAKIMVSTKTKNKMYDYVVIATPLTEVSNIEFHGFGVPLLIHEKYHKTVCTLVKGEINEQFFKMEKDQLPTTILFTDKFHFNAIAKINPVSKDCNPDNVIWKIFSDKELTYDQLNLIFHFYRVISVKDWLAYPEYGRVGVNKSFYLFKNITSILHVNAIEALASAMEMSAIGGHNVASLIIRSVNKNNYPNTSSTVSPHDEF